LFASQVASRAGAAAAAAARVGDLSPLRDACPHRPVREQWSPGMNVLLIALGSHGDVHPFVGIGRRLRERGHCVAVAANDYFRPLVEGAELEFLPLGTAEEYKALATDKKLWDPMRGPQAVFQATARQLRPIYDVAAEFSRRPDSVVAASSLALGARVAQDHLGIPLASVHLSPAIFQSVHDLPHFMPFSAVPRRTPRFVKSALWWTMNRIMDRIIAPPLNALRAELGLSPVKNVLRDYWHSPRLVIGMFPDWFAMPQPDWPEQAVLTGFPLYDEPEITPIDDELEAFLREGEPPIAFTPGSAMWQAGEFFAQSVETCVRLNRRGLLLSRHDDHLPATLPPGVIHVHYAPFSQLLPCCAAFVHHGGIGSSAQALASGVRQLVTPFTHDQPDNAFRLKRLGVAEVIPSTKYRADRIVPAMRRLLDSPDVARACGEVKSRFRGVDALIRTCDLIESLRPTAPAPAPPPTMARTA
jgi:rhamnosyltransferase subunit B